MSLFVVVLFSQGGGVKASPFFSSILGLLSGQFYGLGKVAPASGICLLRQEDDGWGRLSLRWLGTCPFKVLCLGHVPIYKLAAGTEESNL